MTAEQVREILPDIVVCPMPGVLLDCRVIGRANSFATVTPIKVDGCGSWNFSWAAIARAITDGNILYV